MRALQFSSIAQMLLTLNQEKCWSCDGCVPYDPGCSTNVTDAERRKVLMSCDIGVPCDPGCSTNVTDT